MKLQPLNEALIESSGWRDHYVSGFSKKVHIFYYHSGPSKKNIILLHTPVTAIKNCFECFEQLGPIYGFNVFAIDYVPGEGDCSGESRDFTLSNMVSNIDAIYEYVCTNYSDDIHLLGYTGAGGIMAQYYLGTGRTFKSFSQFACGIYGDTTPVGLPKFFVKPTMCLLHLLIKLKPSLTIPFRPPRATGYHKELDNEFYETITVRDPHFFALKANSLLRTLECLAGGKSLLKEPLTCPTLVFKTLHDRYFSRDYFDRYFQSLTCEKKLIEINDTHNSYFMTPEPFMKEIAAWVNDH